MRRRLAARLKHYLPMLGRDRLGGQTVAAFGLKLANAAASFGFSLMVARLFGAAGSGQYAIAVTTVTILSYIVLAGLDYTLLRTAAGDLREGKRGAARGAVNRSAQIVVLLALTVTGVFWLARDPIATIVLHQPGLAGLLGIAILALVPLAMQRIASSALRSSGRVLSSQAIDGPLGTGCAVLALGAMFVAQRAGTIAAPVWLYVGGLCIGALTGWWIYLRSIRDWPAAELRPLAPMLLAGLPVLAINLSNIFSEWYTTVSLGSYWPAAVVGQYRAAWQFVAIAGLVQVTMDAVIGPRIAAAARVGATQEIADIARKSILLAMLLSGPLFIALFCFPTPLLRIFGPEFTGGATALQILAIGQFVRLASGPIGSILFMTGNARWMLAYSAVGVVLCVVLVALLVPTYGAVGAAIATAVTVILRNIAAGFVVHFVLRIHLFRR